MEITISQEGPRRIQSTRKLLWVTGDILRFVFCLVQYSAHNTQEQGCSFLRKCPGQNLADAVLPHTGSWRGMGSGRNPCSALYARCCPKLYARPPVSSRGFLRSPWRTHFPSTCVATWLPTFSRLLFPSGVALAKFWSGGGFLPPPSRPPWRGKKWVAGSV